MYTRDLVVEHIYKAFEKAIYPGNQDLVSGDIRTDWDSRYVYRELKGRSWQQLLQELNTLDDDELIHYQSVYSFMTPDAFFWKDGGVSQKRSEKRSGYS